MIQIVNNPPNTTVNKTNHVNKRLCLIGITSNHVTKRRNCTTPTNEETTQKLILHTYTHIYIYIYIYIYGVGQLLPLKSAARIIQQ